MDIEIGGAPGFGIELKDPVTCKNLSWIMVSDETLLVTTYRVAVTVNESRYYTTIGAINYLFYVSIFLFDGVIKTNICRSDIVV